MKVTKETQLPTIGVKFIKFIVDNLYCSHSACCLHRCPIFFSDQQLNIYPQSLYCSFSTKYHRNNRTMLLGEALDNIPILISVYVVYAVRQQRIHVVSRNVYSLYCVVKSQLENKDELMAEDAAHLNQLFDSWTWQQGDHQSVFLLCSCGYTFQ